MTQDYYERYWSVQGFNPCGELAPETRRLLQRRIVSGMEVADVGCGDGGGFGVWARDAGVSYTGFDVSEHALDRARAHGLTVTKIDDASALPLESSSVDAVVCLEVLEHLLAPHDAVAEFARVIRPGGILVASVPNIAYWVRRIELGLAGRFNPYGDHISVSEPWRDPHIRFFTKGSIKALLRRTGFFDVSVAGESHQPFSLRTRIEGSAWYLPLMRAWPAMLAPTLLVTARR